MILLMFVISALLNRKTSKSSIMGNTRLGAFSDIPKIRNATDTNRLGTKTTTCQGEVAGFESRISLLRSKLTL